MRKESAPIRSGHFWDPVASYVGTEGEHELQRMVSLNSKAHKLTILNFSKICGAKDARINTPSH